MSRIGDRGERACIHVYRRGLASKLFDQSDSKPGSFDSLQDLMDINLELATRYHERKTEKGTHQEKEPSADGSNSSRPPQDSSSKKPHYNNNTKEKNFQVSKHKPHASLLNRDKIFIDYEKEWRIKQGLCTYCGGKNPIETFSNRPQNWPG
ncbi:hypothetical protein O181_022506 [Austropuccinia psidii MF-1]|uniref:Uncharacterized protein n=1 Tax=Austropuccinia psidii MF-1 TaxID=1389203 RepID=A0A9Q3CD03_9BASI|nr:hypothetical protein [Austropuccinia psidii MF-1]